MFAFLELSLQIVNLHAHIFALIFLLLLLIEIVSDVILPRNKVCTMLVNVSQVFCNLLKLTTNVCQLVHIHSKSFQFCIHLSQKFRFSLDGNLFLLFQLRVDCRFLLVTIALQFFLLLVVRTLKGSHFFISLSSQSFFLFFKRLNLFICLSKLLLQFLQLTFTPFLQAFLSGCFILLNHFNAMWNLVIFCIKVHLVLAKLLQLRTGLAL